MKKIFLSILYGFVAGTITAVVLVYVLSANSEIFVALLSVLVSSIVGGVQVKRNSFIIEGNTLQTFGQKGGEVNVVKFGEKK